LHQEEEDDEAHLPVPWLVAGGPVAVAPWRGSGGAVCWFTEKKKNEGDEEENGGGAREGRC
jgi:hypothetical protein